MNTSELGGLSLIIGGRRYRFDPSKYFAVEAARPAEITTGLDESKLREIADRLMESSGAVAEV